MHVKYGVRSPKYIWEQLYLRIKRLRPLNPTPRIWAHIRGHYWSAKIDDISLWPPARMLHLQVICTNINVLQLNQACNRRQRGPPWGCNIIAEPNLEPIIHYNTYKGRWRDVMGIKASFSFSAIVKLKEPVFYILFSNSRHNYTDKKEKKIFLPLYKDI